jgi:pilus assembly protein CpaF
MEDAEVLELSKRARSLAMQSHPSSATDEALDELALDGRFVSDEARAKQMVLNELTGFGPLQEFFADPDIEEIWINRPNEVRFHKAGENFLQRIDLSAEELRRIVQKLLRHSGRRLDRSNPSVDASLADGSRLHVVIPEVTQNHWAVNIRKFSKSLRRLEDLADHGVLNDNQMAQIKMAVRSGKNILVSGATQAGKTTMMCAILAELEGQRLISCEDTFEIFAPLDDWIAMQTRPGSSEGATEVPLRQLVREALRMRPDRIAVGEVRGAEALDLLIALNSGIPGICTIHANSATEALRKMRTLPLLAGGNISEGFLNPTVDSVIDMVIHCERSIAGERSVREVWERDF